MAASSLSHRGTNAYLSGTAEAQVWEVISSLYHPTANPNGYISLGVAENSLMHAELRAFLNSLPLIGTTAKAFTYGDGPAGSIPLRSALTSFFNTYFNPAQPVKPEHLLVTNGCSAAIEHTAWALANPGEAILLGRPYYRAFIPDMGLRPGVQTIGVAFGDAHPCGLDCVSAYETALLAAQHSGIKVRALLLCHPHNPLGRCYASDTIKALMRLCQQHDLHFISDEIYALSVWENCVDASASTVPFHSALSLDTHGVIDPDRVHVLWGLSKDFCANGLRLGVVVSQANPAFLGACRACSLYSSPSSLSENAATAILSDAAFLFSFIRTNQQRLGDAYAHAVRVLQRYGIEHMPGANAAFFLWVDLGKKYLAKHPLAEGAAKEDLTQIIFERLMERRVFLVLGDAAGAEEPGWFRIVFSQAPELVEEGIKRVAEALE